MPGLRSVALCLLIVSLPVCAQDRFDTGVRTWVSLAHGKPANDIPGQGLFGHYRLNERWSIGFGLDTSKFDFEEPAKLLGLPLDPDAPAIDAKAEATIISGWLERCYPRTGSRGEWFLGSGVGFSSLDVPQIRGPLTNGGNFDIITDGGTEIIVSALGGRRLRLGKRWAIELAVRAENHFADWKFEDRVTGASSRIDDYFAYGGHLGVTVSF